MKRMNFVIVCLRPSQNLKLGSRGSPRMEQWWPNLVSEMRKVNSNQKSPGSLLDIAPEIVNEWNGYLEILAFLKLLKILGNFLLLQTDILQKTVIECLCSRLPIAVVYNFHQMF